MKVLYFILLALLVTFFSCTKNEEEDDPNRIIHTSPIKEIDAIMLLQRNSTNLELVLRSQELNGCGNAYISGENDNTPNEFSAYLKEIATPDFCIDTTGYPRTLLFFPTLQNGEYPLTIKIDKTTDKGKLIVSDRKYEIKMESLERLHFPEGTVLEY